MILPLAISGYVLAGGMSSRMGRDKALLELGGRPLIAHAVSRLAAFCSEVHILSNRSELSAFAPLVGDLHPGCGPLGGIEAALFHTSQVWSLFLPVDMPFVEENYLASWAGEVMALADARVALFTVGGRPQPTLCLLHRNLLPYIREAVTLGNFKLNPVLESGARTLAASQKLDLQSVLVNRAVEEDAMFTNLNTPEDFAEAQER